MSNTPSAWTPAPETTRSTYPLHRLMAIGFIAFALGRPALGAPYLFSIGREGADQAFFVQGQSFTPLVQGTVASAMPAWSESGEVRLKTFQIPFGNGQAPPAKLYLYDRLPTPQELAASGANSLAAGQPRANGIYDFASVPLQLKQRYFAVLSQPAMILDAPDVYLGGADLFISGGQFSEGGYDIGFTATFESTPYFVPVPLGPPPASLGLNPFYKKYLDAAGVPVLGSGRVPDVAFYVVRETVLRMVTKRRDVLEAMKQSHSRVGIMSVGEVTTDIPEHSDLYTAFPGTDWNTRARGLGATLARPISTCAEENVMHHVNDRYYGEDIFVHEFAHGIDLTGLRVADPQWSARLAETYQHSISLGRWANTYAAANKEEFLAEAVQSFFNVNLEATPPNGIHNYVNTRDELRAYDPEIYTLVREVFPLDLIGAERLVTLTSELDGSQLRLRWGTQPSVVYDLQFSHDLRRWDFVGLPFIGRTNSHFATSLQPRQGPGLGAYRLLAR